jgi:hypothetical protein
VKESFLIALHGYIFSFDVGGMFNNFGADDAAK